MSLCTKGGSFMDLNQSFKQNSFSRSLINEAKLGAYYTDVNHCERIGQLFAWPEEKVTILEPSIGDATAVEAVTLNCTNKELYGVELNTETFKALENTNKCDYLLNADFLNGVKISNSKFPFVFSNPPYGVHQENGERLEKLFLDKMTNYMVGGGILVYVIPYYVLQDEKFQKCFLNRFNPLAVFKFDDDEYKKYQQIVIIAARRRSFGYMKEWMERFRKNIEDLSKLPYLPALGVEMKTKIPVPTAPKEEIEYFTTLKFDVQLAGRELLKSPLYALIGEKALVPKYLATELGNPPVPLKKDLLYLCAISGGGQGLVGSTETNDLHLQRGVVKVIVQNDVEKNDKGDAIVKETSYSKIALNVIQNDGSITLLE